MKQITVTRTEDYYLLIKKKTVLISFSFAMILDKLGVKKSDKIRFSSGKKGEHLFRFKGNAWYTSGNYVIYEDDKNKLSICEKSLVRYFKKVPKKLYITRL